MVATIDAPDIVRPRARKARGQDRPQYLDSPDLDRVVMIVFGLISEVSALRDRIDTHEALADQAVVPTTDAVEAYELDADRRAQREARRQALLDRMLRVLVEERDAVDDIKEGN